MFGKRQASCPNLIASVSSACATTRNEDRTGSSTIPSRSDADYRSHVVSGFVHRSVSSACSVRRGMQGCIEWGEGCQEFSVLSLQFSDARHGSRRHPIRDSSPLFRKRAGVEGRWKRRVFECHVLHGVAEPDHTCCSAKTSSNDVANRRRSHHCSMRTSSARETRSCTVGDSEPNRRFNWRRTKADIPCAIPRAIPRAIPSLMSCCLTVMDSGSDGKNASFRLLHPVDSRQELRSRGGHLLVLDHAG